MKKILSLVVSLVLIISCMSITAMAADVEPEEPEYNANTGLYSVGTEGELLWVAEQINSGAREEINVRLTSDITVTSDSFAGIGTEEHPFSGEFLGSGYTITLNLDGAANGTDVVALFPYVGGTTAIENLTVAGKLTNTGSQNQIVAGFVGVMTNGADLTLTKCINKATISGGESGVYRASGIVGESESSNAMNTFKLTMNNCENYGDVGLATQSAGILVSYFGGPLTISGCKNYGTVSGKNYGTGAGGLICEFDLSGYYGTEKYVGIIENCMNYGDVTTPYSKGFAGGIFAEGDLLKGEVSVSNCGNEGDISGGYNVGGIGGITPSGSFGTVTIQNCYNTGNIEMTGVYTNSTSRAQKAGAGGIIGSVSSKNTVENCYNIGAISSSSVAQYENMGVGGIAGATSANVKMSKVYNAGRVYSDDSKIAAGGIVGYDNCANFEVCYYLTGTSSEGYGYCNSYNNEITGTIETKSAAELKALATTLGAGFKDNSNPDYHSGYPVLSWEEIPLLPLAQDEEGNCLIGSEADLLLFAAHVNAGEYGLNGKLTDNIVVTEETFTGIGGTSSSKSYTGTFDGNGKSITINIDTGSQTSALFSYVNGAVIKNLTVNGSVKASSYAGVGGIVGYVNSNGVTITNCVNNANITGTTYVGGVVGKAMGSKVIITDTVNNGAITSTATSSAYVGGIVGQAGTGSEIRNCVNNGGITVSGAYVGGIIGYVSDAMTIDGCENTGNMSGGNTVGGIVGYDYTMSGTVTISNCANSGDITAVHTAGGIIGHSNNKDNVIDGCYNTADITISGDTGASGVGGIAGSERGTIKNSYNLGFILAEETSTNQYIGVGGIAGLSKNNTVITNVYNAGRVIGEAETVNVGAIIGYKSTGNLICENVFYLETSAESDVGLTNVEISGTIQSVTEAELKTKAADLGDGFKANVSQVYHDGYPVLVWEEVPVVEGDANGDGIVNSVDAMLVLRIAAEQSEVTAGLDLDMNGDGRINSLDAMLILALAAQNN